MLRALPSPDFRFLVTHARFGNGQSRTVRVWPSDAVRQVLSFERLFSASYKAQTKCAKDDVNPHQLVQSSKHRLVIEDPVVRASNLAITFNQS